MKPIAKIDLSKKENKEDKKIQTNEEIKETKKIIKKTEGETSFNEIRDMLK